MPSINQVANLASSYMTPFSAHQVHPDEITCDAVLSNVDSGLWPDPNQEVMYIRRVVDPQHFYVSVHSKENDFFAMPNYF